MLPAVAIGAGKAASTRGGEGHVESSEALWCPPPSRAVRARPNETQLELKGGRAYVATSGRRRRPRVATWHQCPRPPPAPLRGLERGAARTLALGSRAVAKLGSRCAPRPPQTARGRQRLVRARRRCLCNGCRRAAHRQQVQARALVYHAHWRSSAQLHTRRLGRKIGSGSFGDIYLGAPLATLVARRGSRRMLHYPKTGPLPVPCTSRAL